MWPLRLPSIASYKDGRWCERTQRAAACCNWRFWPRGPSSRRGLFPGSQSNSSVFIEFREIIPSKHKLGCTHMSWEWTYLLLFQINYEYSQLTNKKGTGSETTWLQEDAAVEDRMGPTSSEWFYLGSSFFAPLLLLSYFSGEKKSTTVKLLVSARAAPNILHFQ